MFTGETVHVYVGLEGVWEGPSGEVKRFFLRGLMFYGEEDSSSTPVQGTVGSEGYSSLLGTPSTRR